MQMRDRIIEKLTAGLEPDFLEIIDESAKHRGHAGWREGGETHFRVRIATRYFAGLSRVAQHRTVTDLLKPEFEAGIHALAIEIVPPEGPLRPSNPA